MNTYTYAPEEFLVKFCKAAGIPVFDTTDRACVITRSPAEYGLEGTVVVEWEGSPPRFPIYLGRELIVDGNKIKGERSENATAILRRFLAAHPANMDGSPVWIGTRLKDRS